MWTGGLWTAVRGFYADIAVSLQPTDCPCTTHEHTVAGFEHGRQQEPCSRGAKEAHDGWPIGDTPGKAGTRSRVLSLTLLPPSTTVGYFLPGHSDAKIKTNRETAILGIQSGLTSMTEDRGKHVRFELRVLCISKQNAIPSWNDWR